jgi:serine/threonine-protein phosphatase 2A regulatory subunit A
MTFFSNQYPDIQQLIYSYLARSDEFIAAWQTNKLSQPLIEHVLFSKIETHFYPAQRYVLSTLYRMKDSSIIDQRLHHLAQMFLSKLTNPNLTLPEVLSGLSLLATIYQVPLDITPITEQLEGNKHLALPCLVKIAPLLTTKESTLLSVSLIAQLHDGDSQVYHLAQDCLTAIVPKLKTTTLVRLAHFALARLDDIEGDRYRVTSDFLRAIVLTINKAALIELIPFILVKLDKDHYCLLKGLSTVLTAMVSRLDDAGLTRLIDLILAKLCHHNIYVVSSALNCITAMLPRLNDICLSNLIKPIFMKLEGPHKTNYIPVDVIKCLTAMVPKLNDKTLALWTNPILEKLNRSLGRYHIHEAALDCLIAMALRLEDIKLLSLIQTIFMKPTQNKITCSSKKTVFKCLTVMVTKLNTETLLLWINYILKELQGWNSDICEAASPCLIAMMSRLNDVNLTSLIDPILAKLNDDDAYVYSNTLRHLTAIVPILDITTVVSLIDSIRAKLDHARFITCFEALKCLTVMVPIVDTTTVVSWVDSILVKTKNNYPCVRSAALICLTAMVPKLDNETIVPLLQDILDDLNKNFYPHNKAELIALLTAIVSRLSQLGTTLSADLISLLVPILSHPDSEIAQLCFKFFIHLSIYCHEKLSIISEDKIIQVMKNHKLGTTSSINLSVLSVVYPWLAQIVTSSQQPAAELTITDKTHRVTDRQPDNIDASVQLVSPQQAQVIQRLTAYIARVHSFEDGFGHGFWVAKTSRAINREINVMLAEELMTHLKDKTNNTTDLFSSDAIRALRQQLIKDYALDKRAGYVERPIGSRELNHIIHDAQNIELQPLRDIGGCS